jgi:hypothetical protein
MNLRGEEIRPRRTGMRPPQGGVNSPAVISQERDLR